MQGRHVSSRMRIVNVDLDSLIPKTHRLRKMNKVLNLAFVYDLTKKYYVENVGRPSIDPVLYFKMQVLKYFYGHLLLQIRYVRVIFLFF